MDEQEFKDYLTENEAALDPLEGVWKTRLSTRGVIRSKEDSNRFDVFIIKGASSRDIPGLVEATLSMGSDSTIVATNTDSGFKCNVKRIGKSGAFLLFQNVWVKSYPETLLSVDEILFEEAMLAGGPFLRKLNDKTLYVRFPFHSM